MAKKCIGCGVELQGKDKNKRGYLPQSVLDKEGGELYCQRCFKIKNYGEYIPVEMTRDDYREEVKKTLPEADVAIAVFDIIDFEGSFDDEILDVLREMDSIVVINKIDLIPDEKHPSEVANWVKERLGEEGIAPLDIAIVSSKKGYGTSGIFKKINHFYPNGARAIVLGVTNVGKSSIINRLLGKNVATESKYPGTTLKSSKKKVTSNGELKPIFSVYASKNVTYHDTNLEKAAEMEKEGRTDLFSPPCEKCAEQYKKEKIVTEKFVVESGEELVFKGLGWVSVKRGPLEMEITYPERADIIIREAFIKPKR